MGSAKVQGDLWGQAPVDWASVQEPMHTPLFQAMLDAASVGAGTRLLDVGCGGGGASAMAAARGAQVSGLDAAEGLIEIVRQKVPSGDFRVGDIEELPFGNDAFDVVLAANSVQYAAERVIALRELGRVCTREGRIVVGLFGPAEKVEYRAILKAVREVLPEPPMGDGPFGLSASGKLEDLMEEAGLKVLENSEVNCPFSYPDFETFWRGNAAAGPLQGAIRTVGQERLKAALREAAEAFRTDDGGYSIEQNMFKYVVAVL
jgi:SAM-dependent methyltransferase